VKIGLLGCGEAGINHLEAMQKAGTEIAAVCDINEEKARNDAERKNGCSSCYKQCGLSLSFIKNVGSKRTACHL
jgi:predicted dehydrogenase